MVYLYYNKVEISGVNTSQLKVLRESEKMELLKKVKQGDMQAREELINGNLRLVLSVIQRFAGRGEGPDDLFQVGCIGLIKAISTYKEDYGSRLATYAARCIDNELLMHFRSKKKTAREVSLYEPIGTDKEGNEISLLDIIESPPVDIVEEYSTREDIRFLLSVLKDTLSEKEYQVICLRYGLFGIEEQTQREIATQLGISRSYVSRIEKNALEKLKKLFNYR